ncbi:hypothetical protein C5C00_01360 [Rathayibacter rathayi]|uniref:SGNH/GDSL hydrolase family protein n=1 Tax=Rathayibacter rathayi TaxID=33887 RepID=UPI000CE79AD3|nr:hypothetical protein C5C47_00630 [Rathayibacter rathayi]PPG98701.1 hypothetical protein C5C00_01360 [Rathayibacter rathayi]
MDMGKTPGRSGRWMVGVGVVALALLGSLVIAQPTQATQTRTILALGDSITRAATTCGTNRDCAENSWATGSASAVRSITTRLEAADSTTAVQTANYAKSGSLISGVTSRISAAVAAGEQPDVVTLLIGGNDLCSLTLEASAADGYAMTSAASFASSATGIMRSLSAAWPTATVLVSSLPNVAAEWKVVKPTPGALVWAQAGVCSATRGVDAETGVALTGTAYLASVAAAAERSAQFNRSLAAACSVTSNRCVWDGGALSATPVGLDKLSTTVDWFHPNVAGQALIADVLWGAWDLGEGPTPSPSPTPARDTTAPVVAITAPTSGTTVRGSVTLIASSKDAVGTTRLSFWSGATKVGDATKASDGSWRLTLASWTYPDGRYTLVAHAYDAAGNDGRSPSITLTR